jgi:hypothetical protein
LGKNSKPSHCGSFPRAPLETAVECDGGGAVGAVYEVVVVVQGAVQ